jgi:hypothetical protein
VSRVVDPHVDPYQVEPGVGFNFFEFYQLNQSIMAVESVICEPVSAGCFHCPSAGRAIRSEGASASQIVRRLWLGAGLSTAPCHQWPLIRKGEITAINGGFLLLLTVLVFD